MPINYLELQPQITEYCLHARDQISKRPERVNTAIALLARLADEIQQEKHQDLPATISKSSVKRSALPAHEIVNSACQPENLSGAYELLASDGSQITSTHHDRLPIALINTATVHMKPGSGKAPQTTIQTEFIRTQGGSISIEFLPEQRVNTMRDVRELQVLANFHYASDNPLIVLGDGPLELFQEPRSGEEHQILFRDYQQALYSLCNQNRIIAGYTDKPRADLVARLLEWVYRAEPELDISNISDAEIFSELLEPGCRSAIFRLHSPSSTTYLNEIALHFFYLNVGRQKQPWIVRVEITASTASNPAFVTLLQHALLSQCAMMGARPYPYILHRAHEEAVVQFEERQGVIDMLTHTLFEMGIQPDGQSNKLIAKELGKRTRLK